MPLELADLVDANRTAVVLVEMQQGVIGDATFLPDLADAAAERGIVAAATRLCAAARDVGIPVIHATAEDLPDHFGASHNARLFAAARKLGAANLPGTRATEPLTELWDDDDILLPRRHGLSPLTGTAMDSVLRNEGIGSLVIAGVSLNVALTNTVFDAINRSYQVILPTDAVVGVPVDYGDAVLGNSLALLTTMASTDDITATWSLD